MSNPDATRRQVQSDLRNHPQTQMKTPQNEPNYVQRQNYNNELQRQRDALNNQTKK